MSTITDYKKELADLLSIVSKEGASDLHLSRGRLPTIRVSGVLIPLTHKSVLTDKDTEGLIAELLSPEQLKRFKEDKEMDFSYSDHEARFRGNCYFERGSMSVALRLIPKKIKTLAELNLPEVLSHFAEKEQGFFLVCGPVGHGKTTTLAAIIDLINESRAEHIVTIEDPIEFIYEDKKAFIDQREVKIDTKDFPTALASGFREDIDVIFIGEMRDPATISIAVTASETGHMVYSTIHTNTAAQTIDRIIDSFTGQQQEQIRVQLSGSLTGIFSQRLVPRISGGLIPAYELLINNNAVANLIRENRTHEINTVIETGIEQGMIDMNRSLAELVRKGEITVENAYRFSTNPKILERLI